MAEWGCLQVALLIVVCVALYSTARSIVRWNTRQYFTSATPRPRGATLYARLFNPLRRSLGIRPLRVIPYVDTKHRDEVALLERADRLTCEIRTALKQSALADIRKTDWERQANAVPDSLVNSLWTLSRLRRIDRLLAAQPQLDGQARHIIAELQTRLRVEMNQSVETLSTIPLSLLQVELARSDDQVERLVHDLNDTNKRLVDLSVSYKETKTASGF